MADDPNSKTPKPTDPDTLGQKPNDPNATVLKRKTDWVQLIPSVIYGVIAVALLIGIGWGLAGKAGFLAELKDKEVARGLITFLIAITTVGIAVILAISTLFGADGDEQDKRFDRGKQVLSVLIGVLGTIVGFYFGSPTDTKLTKPQTITIAPASFDKPQPKKGEVITMSSFVFGGKSPYTYSITFDTPLIPGIPGKSTDGPIIEKITLPETLDTDKDVKFQITVTDSDSKTGEYNKDGAQKISVKAK